METENEQPRDEQPTPENEGAEQAVATAEQPQPEGETQPVEGQAEGQAEAAAPAEPELSEEEKKLRLKKALESVLFITDHPLPLAKLCKIVGVTQKESKRVVEAIEELKQELDERQYAFQVIEVADGYQMGTRPAFAPFVKKLYTEKMTMKLSTAAHETLAIIAYKQPLTRAEIEQIRGVEVIAAIETLLEKRLIEVVGRKESVGRPLLYGTTVDFLRHFGLRSLEDLPPIDSFKIENAPLGEQQVPTEAPIAEEAKTEEKPLPSCVEAQAKEFAAGEEMAAERTEEVSSADADEAQPKKKSIWDE